MAAVAGRLAGALRRPRGTTGWWSWVTTVDHKRIGILFGVTAFLFFVIAGVEALLIRLQLARPAGDVVSPEVYSQLFTMHGTTMILLVVLQLTVGGLGNYLVPLMIGARDVAFPRLNAFSYWVYLFGGILLHTGFVLGTVADVGWYAYAPLTGTGFSPGPGVDFWVLGLQVAGVSAIASALNFIVTIINLRAPGLGLMRMPVFVWNVLVTSFLVIFAFPPLTVALTLLMFDRFFGTPFLSPAAGSTPLLWQHLFWVFGHPEVYILILPAFGIVSEVVPTFSRKPLFGYPFVVFATVAIAFLGFGVWVHHMFVTGLGPVPTMVFSATTMLIAVPTGVKIFNWLGTLWGGSLQMRAPLYFALGFIAMFIIGGLSGVMHASPPVDTHQQDSYFVVAHLHYVLFGGSIFGLFAGIYYWFPKISGRLLGEGLGKVHFWLMFAGFNLTFFPMHFLGVDGMPRRIYTYDAAMGWGTWNLVSTIGAFLIAVSILVFVVNFLRSVRSGERAGDDPWDGRTLEWATSSPPPPYNFAGVPVVRWRDPVWAEKRRGGRPVDPPESPAGGAEEAIPLPGPSYWPVVVAAGVALGFGLLLVSPWLAGVGIAVAAAGVYGWALEPPVG